MPCRDCLTATDCVLRSECLRNELLQSAVNDVRAYIARMAEHRYKGYSIDLDELRSAIAHDLMAEVQFSSASRDKRPQ